jgi:hypothetical protein
MDSTKLIELAQAEGLESIVSWIEKKVHDEEKAREERKLTPFVVPNVGVLDHGRRYNITVITRDGKTRVLRGVEFRRTRGHDETYSRGEFVYPSGSKRELPGGYGTAKITAIEEV